MNQSKIATKNSFVRVTHDEDGIAEAMCNRIASGMRRGKFVLCLGGTASSDVPGLSAAGKTPELRRLTPAADAEALMLGRVVSIPELPRSPAGVVAPVVITRACAKLLNWQTSVVDCGTFRSPATDLYRAGDQPAACVSSGKALPAENVQRLFDRGVAYGEGVAKGCDYLVLAECVPGGTTTALAILTACGYDVDGLLSGSVPKIDQALRSTVVQEGLKRAALDAGQVRKNPLLAVQAVGDPMQPFVAGVLSSACRNLPVVLAGGSQMLAVHALARDIASANKSALPPNVVTMTTKWVVVDPYANLKKLSEILAVPLVSAWPDFLQSCHAGLRAYEDGNVKEGVGAGAAMAIAKLTTNCSEQEIMSAIDSVYDELSTS